MTTDEIIHQLRNPYGLNKFETDTVRLAAAAEIERLQKLFNSMKDAYQNMSDFAESNGLDVTTYGNKTKEYARPKP